MAEVFRRQNIPAALLLHAVPKSRPSRRRPWRAGRTWAWPRWNLGNWRKLPVRGCSQPRPRFPAPSCTSPERTRRSRFRSRAADRRARPPAARTTGRDAGPFALDALKSVRHAFRVLPDAAQESLAEGVPCLLGPIRICSTIRPICTVGWWSSIPSATRLSRTISARRWPSAMTSWRPTGVGHRGIGSACRILAGRVSRLAGRGRPVAGGGVARRMQSF